MLFNSYIFLYAFLPLVLAGYYLLKRQRNNVFAKSWLVLASLVFYGAWYQAYLFLLLGSIVFNYLLALYLNHSHHYRKTIVSAGVIANLALLGYYKYTNFFLEGIYYLLDKPFSPLNILLPLAISFFTFQQIAYLMDVYKHRQSETNFINYALFVSFFHN